MQKIEIHRFRLRRLMDAAEVTPVLMLDRGGPNLYLILKGKAHRLELKTAQKVAEVLGCTIEDFTRV